MAQWIDAMFVRGGTSKGLFFGDDALTLALPGEPGADAAALETRDRVLCAAMGSPDRFGRQLDGMGGGVSSLSKAMIVGRSQREGVDLDYTFAQVSVDEASVDYAGNCGNLSSGVVPFALAAGLLEREDGPQQFRLFNTNTGKQVLVRLTVAGGEAAVSGSLAIPGVAGTGSPIELVYPQPGGSRTSGLLPSGERNDVLAVGGSEIRASLVDATNPLVLVAASEIGLTGAELPAEIDADPDLLALLDEIRRAGAVRMGMCADPDAAPLAVPKVVLVAPPMESRLLDGTVLAAADVDLLARTISMNQAHGAVPGTAAMCIAAAAGVYASVVAETLGRVNDGDLRIGTPSGVVTAGAKIATGRSADPLRNGAIAIEASIARTARILMRGQVSV